VRSGMTLFVLCVVVAGGTLVGCEGGTAAEGPTTRGSADASATADVSTAPPVTDIPDAAFLQPPDLGTGRIVPKGYGTDALAPCYKQPVTADAQLTHREQIVGVYKFSARKVEQPDGIVWQIISVYRPGGATAFLAEIRAQIARCPTTPDPPNYTREASILAEGFGGDESLLWLRKGIYSGDGAYDENFDFVALIRFREIVAFLHVLANAMNERADADRLISAAITRAAALP
jgi:hypothetical protein